MPTLIDAGEGRASHLDAVLSALHGSALRQVLVTHAHLDHASGAPALAARFPAAVFRKLPWSDRDGRYAVDWLTLADGDVVEAGDAQLRVVHTPGHAPDHVCFWHEATRTLFGGDLAMVHGTVWIPGNRGGDLGAYLASLRRIIALAPDRILPAHGEIIDEPLPLLARYLAHRARREEQIIAALRAAPAPVEAIVGAVYRDLAPALWPMAGEGVLSHLRKLEAEGRAGRVDDVWHMIDP